jgi:hypothetical protein
LPLPLFCTAWQNANGEENPGQLYDVCGHGV